MTLYDKRKKKLIEELKDKNYRDAFVEESINVGIPFQIKALREQRDLTQKEFEKEYGIKQAAMSRLENPNYSGFTLSTLKKIASLFDVGLIVRFVPISDLVEWELNLTSKSLKALSFKDEPYFKEQEKKTTAVLGADMNYSLETLDNVINFQEYLDNKITNTTQNKNNISMAVRA